jgi:surfactin synthase thioesterase subunit
LKKLICFPYAGVGLSFFRGWLKPLNQRFQLVAVQLPGREERFAEPLFSSIEQAIDSLFPSIIADLSSNGEEILIFGHSMGAMLAFELCCRLEQEYPAKHYRLVVSGSPAPHHPRTQQASGMSDVEFLAQVQSFAGYRHPALEHPEMRELLLPILRADVLMHEKYFPTKKIKLHMPVMGVRGCNDELVSRAEVMQWEENLAHPLLYRELAGGHMYLADSPDLLFNLFDEILQIQN